VVNKDVHMFNSILRACFPLCGIALGLVSFGLGVGLGLLMFGLGLSLAVSGLVGVTEIRSLLDSAINLQQAPCYIGEYWRSRSLNQSIQDVVNNVYAVVANSQASSQWTAVRRTSGSLLLRYLGDSLRRLL